MTDLSRSNGRREIRFGFYPYLSAELPDCKLAFGLVLTGKRVTFERLEGKKRGFALVEAIQSAMGSKYELQIHSVRLRQPYVSRHKCGCCGGPTFNGPHVDEAIRRQHETPRRLVSASTL
jgi:hypothetical protein